MGSVGTISEHAGTRVSLVHEHIGLSDICPDRRVVRRPTNIAILAISPDIGGRSGSDLVTVHSSKLVFERIEGFAIPRA